MEEITIVEYDRIRDDFYIGRNLYEAESCNGNNISVMISEKFWETDMPFAQYEALKCEIWYSARHGRLLHPDAVKCFRRKVPGLKSEKDLVRDIADAYWKECHDEYVRDQIESGESTAEEMAAAFCDSTHSVVKIW